MAVIKRNKDFIPSGTKRMCVTVENWCTIHSRSVYLMGDNIIYAVLNEDIAVKL